MSAIIKHPGPLKPGRPSIARRTAMIAARPPHPRREHPRTSRAGGAMRRAVHIRRMP